MEVENQEGARLALEAACSKLANTIAECVPDGVAFVFMLTDFGEKGNAAYCSNAEREDMIALLRETANRIEGVGN